MQIELTKEQYRDLVTLSGLGGFVLDILGDEVNKKKYKKLAKKMEILEEHILKYAEDFGCNDLIEEFEGKNVLHEDVIQNTLLPLINDYDGSQVFSFLANKLAWRDFKQDHSDAELEVMAKENSGYFGVDLYKYEQKYWDEFEKYGIDRLEIKK